MFCAGRIPQDDLERVMAACGGSILTTVSQVEFSRVFLIKKLIKIQIDASVLGKVGKFYEQQVGSERYD